MIGGRSIGGRRYGPRKLTIAQIEYELSRAFGGHPMDWPVIYPTRPRWYHFKRRREEQRVIDALAKIGFYPRLLSAYSRGDRRAFHEQLRRGQGVNEDAGGYRLRCWLALLGLPFTPALSYAQASADFASSDE